MIKDENSHKAGLIFAVTVPLALVLVFLCGVNYGRSNASPPSDRDTAAGALPDETPEVESLRADAPPAKSRPGTKLKALVPIGPGHPIGENSIADIAQRVAPAVVNIEVTPLMADANAKPVAEPASPGAPDAAPLVCPKGFRQIASGSGFILSADGFIVTNSHLVRGPCAVKVTLNDQRAFKAELIGRDFFTDLAVLKIPAKNLPTITFCANGEVRPGDWAIAIGNPLGFDHTVTLGIVSAINRSLTDMSAHVELIQTDAAINPGNSGGPLLNIHGEVIGLNTAIRSDAQNISFAIPTAVIRQVSTLLIKDGAIERPYLGMNMRDWDNRIISNPNYPSDGKGVIVLRVLAGGPAALAGLSRGDFITRFGGAAIASAKDVRAVVRNHKPGDCLNLSVVHDGKLDEKKLTIGRYPAEEQLRAYP